MIDWLSSLAGLLVGLIVGMTGVGGGSLMAPILILMFGIAPHTAVGTDLWFAAITKSFGAAIHQRQNTADMKIVGRLCLGSIPAALLTLAWLFASGTNASQLRSDLVIDLLGVLLILSSLATLRRKWISANILRMERKLGLEADRWTAQMTVVAGAILGVLVTLTSVGAGAIGATMLLILYPVRLTAKRLVGTDIAHAVPLTLVGGIGYLFYKSVDGWLLASLLVGSIPGIVIGSRMAAFLPERAIQIGLAIVLAITGVKLLT